MRNGVITAVATCKPCRPGATTFSRKSYLFKEPNNAIELECQGCEWVSTH